MKVICGAWRASVTGGSLSVQAYVDGRPTGRSPYRPHGLILGAADIVDGRIVVTKRRYEHNRFDPTPGGVPFWCPAHGEVRVNQLSQRDGALVATAPS